MRGDVTVLHHHLSLVGGIYRMFPASPALVLLCVGKALVDSQHHSMRLSRWYDLYCMALLLFLLLTWLSPWTNSHVVRKNSDIDAHLMSGLWDLYKYMYENRNIYLYFTNFIMYHIPVNMTEMGLKWPNAFLPFSHTWPGYGLPLCLGGAIW